MKAINKKLVRDLWSLKGQSAAIASVIACGAATFIMSVSTLESLRGTQQAFYRDYRFADVFGSVRRAPESLHDRIENIPGVDTVELRVTTGANIEMPGFSDPVKAQIMSVPDSGISQLNRVFLRRGRMVDGTRDNEVLVSEAFADAHRIATGDTLRATINGRQRSLRIVGIALSPEFIYQLPPGSLVPDYKRFVVMWMARTPLEAALDMKGAFNDVTLTLGRGHAAEPVIDQLDALLARYGGLGAISRADQLSNRYLSEEFKQLGQMAKMFPAIFLGVAAFLLNVVVTRLINTQREQVAVLKAFGYTDGQIVAHYLKLIVVVVLVGVAFGVGIGIWLGRGMSSMYSEFYKFPFLVFTMRPAVAAWAAVLSAGGAVLGTVYSVYRAASLPPAQAMQPPPPAKYRVSIVERLGLRNRIAQPTRMIIRNIERRPVKALLTVLGTAFACAILIVGQFFNDAVTFMIDVQFKQAQREDVAVSFAEPTSARAMYSLRGVNGVEYVEPVRSIPARLRFEHRTYRTTVHGIPEGAALRRLLDLNFDVVEPPPEGVILTDHLAETLGVRVGQNLVIEVLDANRAVREVPVVGFVKEYIGVAAYMQMPALNRMLGEGAAITGVYLSNDSQQQTRIYSELQRMPRVIGISIREAALESFRETMANQVLTFAFFNTLFAIVIAMGVIYNSTRIAFSERARELASLRVLGFTRGEISYILLGELGVLGIAALPVGLGIGRLMSAFMIRNVQTDLFRIPLVIYPRTYAFAALVVLIATVLSAWMMKRKLDRLDLVAVLKTKE